MAKEITFSKGNLCILYVLYIFPFGAKDKQLQKAPWFEMDFVLNLPCAQLILLACRIHDPESLMWIALKD